MYTISCHLMGGLGNQLFQIFATIALSLKYDKHFIFPYSKSLKTGIERPTYWDTIFSEIKGKTTHVENARSNFTNYTINTMPRIPERSFRYDAGIDANVCNMHEDSCLIGYFQTAKYFAEYYNEIIGILKIREKQNIYGNKCVDKQTVSMHFRVGDYLVKQEYYPVMNVKYYIGALRSVIDTVGENIRVMCFFEEGDRERVGISIAVLKKTFPNVEFEDVDTGISDWEQLLMMSVCEHCIIANSSFSWWGAYLNENENKIVCCPDKWFGPAMHHNDIGDLIPSQWRRICP